MTVLKGRRIVLGVSGGIAAYKAAELVRLLVKAGADVHVVLSEGGARFVTAVTFQALSGNTVWTDLWDARTIEHAVLVGTATSRFNVAPVPPQAHLRTLVIHGEHDDTVPLSTVLDWARAQVLPVTVVPGGGHFFHGQLTLLKNLVVRHLQSGA